jgi:[lysine-biosynthesis-protein LysW]--L-2-aminoadipate ligase
MRCSEYLREMLNRPFASTVSGYFSGFPKIKRAAAAVIIGDPDPDQTGGLVESALLQRGVPVVWMSIEEAMSAMSIDGESFLDIARRDPSALSIDPEAGVIARSSALSRARLVLVVSCDYGSFEHAIIATLHKAGIITANHPKAVRTVADKWATDEVLRAAGLAVPKSQLVSTMQEACDAARELVYPIVVKQLNGTQGSAVLLANDEKELRDVVHELALSDQPLLLQQYIECDSTDRRMLFIDGKFKAGFLRVARSGDFRSNTALGGEVRTCEFDARQIRFGSEVARALGLRFGGLDIGVVTEVGPGREYLEVGQPFCIEANAAPALYSFPELYGIDLSEDLVTMMLEPAELNRFRPTFLEPSNVA